MTGASPVLAWLTVAGVGVLLIVTATAWPWRLDVSARAKGLADGSWVLAAGVALSALSLAFVWASATRPQLTFCWGKHQIPLKKRQPRSPETEPSVAKSLSSNKLWRVVVERLNPLDLALRLLAQRKHLRLRYFVVDVAFGFRDPVLTGRMVAGLAMLSAVVPAPIEIRQAPRWDFEDGWDLQIDGRAVVRPMLMLLDTAAYVVRELVFRKAPVGTSLPAPNSSKVG